MPTTFAPEWADAAAGVEDSVAGFGGEEIGGDHFVDASSFAVGFAGNGGREVEGLAPAPLVDVGD